MMQCYLLFVLSFLAPFYAAAQVEFVRNDGQWEGDFNYRAETGKGDVYLSHNSFTYLLGGTSNPERIEALKHGQTKGPLKLDFHAFRVHFEGGAPHPKIEGSKEQSWYYNYFLTKDPAKWKSNIHPALAVDYKGLYPGIDLHVSSEKSNVKYEFLVAAGKDPAAIKLRYEGADGITLKNGNLIIKTSVGDVQELKPYSYQYTDEGRKEVPCRYRLKGNTVAYDLYEGYDASRPLVIDPTVVFCTFSGSTADNWGYTATYDAQGNFYGGGAVFNDRGAFPVTTGAFQSTFAGGFNDPNYETDDTHGLGIACDIGIIKFNPTGTTKIYATYIGGSNNEVPHSMVVDANNNLIIGGKTHSANYPISPGAYDNSYNGAGDIIITKLNSAGTALVGSTFIGGSGKDGSNFSGSEMVYGNLKYNYGDDSRSEVLVDNSGNVYLAGCSYSTNFPLVNASQAGSGGGQDAVVIKLNPTLSSLVWSTYLGGVNDDAGYVMTLNNAQTQLYVGGGTMSSNFPFSSGTWKSAYQGGLSDGYIARFQNSGTYTRGPVTAVGTANYDQVFGVQIDATDNVYAMGQSLGGTFPVTAGVYSNPNSSQFIIKMNSALSTNIFSTVYGSGDPSTTNISPVAFLVDTCENIYISGWGGKLALAQLPATIGTTRNMPTTPNAIQPTTDGSDFYFIVLSRNAQSLLYGSFFGRSSGTGEHVDGGTSRFDKAGVIYQAICGGCGGGQIPTTPGTYSPINASNNCNLAALKIAFELGAVDAQGAASPNAKGCAPFTVQFQNNSINATSYVWDFGDGSPTTTQAAPQHTFNTVGTFQVKLKASNPNACRTIDSTYVTIVVDNNSIQPDFNFRVIDSCGPYTVNFTNTSRYSPTQGSQGFTQFTWLFGDNTSFNGVTPPLHTYPNGGSFTVTLIMKDSTACNSPDTVQKTFTINNSSVAANFSITDSLCEGVGVTFTNTSQNAVTNSWDFGDNTTSTAASPVHTYATPGPYTIKLVVTNPNACNKADSITKTVTVRPAPTADFTFSPVPPVSNTPIQFTNASRNATDYTWAFGDGDKSADVNPNHQYRRTGTYTVCLEARNRGCKDTICKDVAADVLTGAELPTAFSPNGDGSNDHFYVRGGAIESSSLKIFNRWGQLVFESENAPPNNPAYGWNGNFKGKEQEMEVYGWVLNVTFIDGTTAQRKGNVTLLR
jgi:gliding motility-associated-like protein